MASSDLRQSKTQNRNGSMSFHALDLVKAWNMPRNAQCFKLSPTMIDVVKTGGWERFEIEEGIRILPMEQMVRDRVFFLLEEL